MKRRMIGLLAAVMCLGLMAGCGKTADKSNPVKELLSSRKAGSTVSLYRFDGEKTLIKSFYKAAQTDEVLESILPAKSKEITKNTDKVLSKVRTPVYGLEIYSKGGLSIRLSYADGVWVDEKGKVYQGDSDIQKIFEETKGQQEREFDNALTFPNAAIYGKYDRNYLTFYQEIDEKSMIEYPWVSIKIVEFQEKEKILCSIENHSEDTSFAYGEGYYVVRELEGKWYRLPAFYPVEVDAVLQIAMPGETVEKTFNVSPWIEVSEGRFLEKAEEGAAHYRVVMEPSSGVLDFWFKP